MRLLLLTLLILFLLEPSVAQTRLDPSDSSATNEWFNERTTDWIFTTSFDPNSMLLIGYNGMFDFLENQGIDMDRLIGKYGFGIQWRYRRVLLTFNGGTSNGTNNGEMNANGRQVYLDQDYLTIDFLAGYIVYSNRFVSVIPRFGVGLSHHSVQYTFENTSVPFDFRAPSTFQSIGSPNLVHESGNYVFDVAFINGFHNKKRFQGIYGASMGIRHGWSRRSWKAVPGEVTNSIRDRSGELFVTAMIGIVIGPRNRS